MRKIITLILTLLILASCSKTFIQIFETKSTNATAKEDFYVYETDSVRITYAFWSLNGVMSFAIYNKLDKPIYVDWKNSSFIHNDKKLNYWIDEFQTKSTSVSTGYYQGYSYNGPLILSGSTINRGISTQIQETSSTAVKPERITFIPPKSNYYRSQFYLLPIECYTLNVDCNKSVVARNDNFRKKTTVYSEDFNLNNSPLIFRNYLSFSFSENSSQFFYIDNGFYINSIKEMDIRHDVGQIQGVDADRMPIYSKTPFEKMTSFYIFVPKDLLGVEERIKYSK